MGRLLCVRLIGYGNIFSSYSLLKLSIGLAIAALID
ncbi:MAG: hypothetical protein JWQ66_3349 [Mucilaginibacter sp.]|nr:hypothetical protein [Mucilaginibacter sp.]